ncbi:hypothetical protein F3Y22_tig00111402pilonHSYRG01062 [Hibiscus syriacus]|uniref:C2H2-type domain-containing protein n=1 Tax=Hibiscus syriacus TaxID=106335 RepID=A0A6A2YLC1_HIBSY|nr:hypothetical protein F3Y22_tig00111402pilonHSYRG01062 [Hibiscus syriacus]
MATEPLPSASATATAATTSHKNRYRLIFELPINFFKSCRLLSPSLTSLIETLSISENSSSEYPDNTDEKDEKSSKTGIGLPKWTCNTCKAEFDFLQDQLSHFKSDIHHFEVSSISGSEDEADKGAYPRNDASKGLIENIRKKCLRENEVIERLKALIQEPKDNASFRIVLLSSGGRGGSHRRKKDAGCLRENEVIERLKALIQEPKDNASFRIVLQVVEVRNVSGSGVGYGQGRISTLESPFRFLHVFPPLAHHWSWVLLWWVFGCVLARYFKIMVGCIGKWGYDVVSVYVLLNGLAWFENGGSMIKIDTRVYYLVISSHGRETMTPLSFLPFSPPLCAKKNGVSCGCVARSLRMWLERVVGSASASHGLQSWAVFGWQIALLDLSYAVNYMPSKLSVIELEGLLLADNLSSLKLCCK